MNLPDMIRSSFEWFIVDVEVSHSIVEFVPILTVIVYVIYLRQMHLWVRRGAGYFVYLWVLIGAGLTLFALYSIAQEGSFKFWYVSSAVMFGWMPYIITRTREINRDIERLKRENKIWREKIGHSEKMIEFDRKRKRRKFFLTAINAMLGIGFVTVICMSLRGQSLSLIVIYSGTCLTAWVSISALRYRYGNKVLLLVAIFAACVIAINFSSEIVDIATSAIRKIEMKGIMAE